jgi:hypothetical protein
MKKAVIICILLFILQQSFSQTIQYTNGNNAWNEDSLGNHRAVVDVTENTKTAFVKIEWRRRDSFPEKKRIIIEDAQTQQRILNVKAVNINRESGELYFEATSGKGKYYVYYMPYKNEGRSNYPKGVYLKLDTTASTTWLQTINAVKKYNAVCREIQSINAFNSFYPMEVIATASETKNIVQQNKKESFLVFPELRQYSIRMQHDLPSRWIEQGAFKPLQDTTDKDENFAYQLGIYALRDMKNVSVDFADLTAASGAKIPSAIFSCLNMDGTTYDARPLHKTVDVAKNNVQALWCLATIPTNIAAGTYKGFATVKADGIPSKKINISIVVTNNVAINHGANEPWKMTRLAWLNSTMAQDNEVISPYTPLQITDNTISLLGRKIELNNNGLPKQIQTFFTEEMTDYATTPNNILAAPFQFNFIQNNTSLPWSSSNISFIKKEAGTVQWQSTSNNKTVEMNVTGSLEFDGFLHYTVKVTALNDADFDNINMQLPFTKDVAKYMMGLGEKGEAFTKDINWKWDVAHKNQDGAWIGNVNAGLQYSLRDENYMRPLNTNFYLLKPLLLPTSWGNDNKGGINITTTNNAVVADNYTGAKHMNKGDVLYFNFNLLITPFHTINTDFQWRTRFYHKYNNLDTIKATGATVVNIHHATPINPWINYPFIEWKKMKDYIDSAHALGLKVKIYNTIRELSDHAYETFALRSLGHEVYSTGKGGGFSWLQEHVGDDYIAAWFVPEIKDAAIINSGMNRWHNYYVEGMNWLTQHVGIDGIYLDDVAFDRVTMKRIKRVLTKDDHPGIIDLHSANQYNKSDGFNNSAMLYMENFPYLNRLWFGEYFDYEKNSPGFFLTEVSGIPFGLMGEMLEGGGNAWRGMVYGMTNRMPWTENADPRPIWKVWDDFGMQGTKMFGYWSSNCAVTTTNNKVLATVYKKDKQALVAVASWADDDTSFQLKIDWNKLGIDASKATIVAPGIKNFQQAATFKATNTIPVQKAKGWIFIIKEN